MPGGIPSGVMLIQGHLASLSSQEPGGYSDIKLILGIICKSQMAAKTHCHQGTTSSDTHRHEHLQASFPGS